MKLDPSKCTVVAVGSWNPAIFTPDWVADQLNLSGKALSAEVAFLAGAYRFSTTRVVLELHPGRLQFAPVAAGSDFAAGTLEEAMRDVQEAVVGIAKALPVTPLTAFGVNFGWLADRSSLRSDFVGVPEEAELSSLGCSVQAVSVIRVLTDNKRGVRTTLTVSHAHESTVQLEVNQHREVRKCDGIVEQLDVAEDYEHARRLVEEAYVRQEGA